MDKETKLHKLMEDYKKEKEQLQEQLRSLGCPEKMLKGKSLDGLKSLLDQLG